ncbi:hypothetical protein MC885_003994, partial [Smutsia gigantea]
MLTLSGWWWDGVQDQLQLVERGCAREQGPPPQHLPQDATQTPHVHRRGVAEELTEDVALVDVLQQSALADDGVQVSVWESMWVSLGARPGLA